MSQSGQIAVIMAAYNAAATLDRAVQSALAQPEVAELCIVDDASTDDTVKLAQAWAARDARVTVQRAAVNAGPGAARNAAIAATKAPWVGVLDADDYMLPGRFAALLAHAADADFVADALVRTSEDKTPTVSIGDFSPWTLSFETFVLGDLERRSGRTLELGFLKPIYRRAFLETHKLRYRGDLRLGEDYDFYARALAFGARFILGNAAGYVSVERPGSISKNHTPQDLERHRDCDDVIAQIRAFSPAEKRALRRHWNSVDCRLQWRRLIDAVKARDVGAALKTFHTADAAIYLTGKLGEQAWLRGAAAFRRA